MSHGIEKPIDRVFSIIDAEWHGLAEVTEKIDDEVVNPLLFNILEGRIVIDIEGESVQMDQHKALVGDLRFRQENEPDVPKFVPLNIPKNSYQKIENRQVWEAMKKAIADIDGKVSCIGTLEAGKKFFISVDIGDGEFSINKDKFKANLCFITSHDGTLAIEAYDSTVRIVCMNTLRWSRDAAGEVGFKVYHSANASLAMASLGDLVNAILKGRADFRNTMEYLASVSISETNAANLVAGYFVNTTNTDELSTRSRNATEEIMRLFKSGQGNHGKNLYDLLNGATEYWTNGDGVGKRVGNSAQRVYKANFAKAADHKNAFANLLMNEQARKEAIAAGKNSGF